MKAEILESIRHGRTMKFTHGSAVTKLDVIAGNGNMLVALNDADASAENVYLYRGKTRVPKNATVAFTAGDACYYNSGNDNVDATDTGTKVGMVLEDAAASDTEAVVMLTENA